MEKNSRLYKTAVTLSVTLFLQKSFLYFCCCDTGIKQGQDIPGAFQIVTPVIARVYIQKQTKRNDGVKRCFFTQSAKFRHWQA
jgi:hypothetical protein